MTTTTPPKPGSLLALLGGLDAFIAQCGEATTDQCSADELLMAVRLTSSTLTKLEALRVKLIQVADSSGAIATTGSPSTFAWLRGQLNFAPSQAAKLLSLGEQMALPRCADTAEAWSSGTITTEHADVISRTLKSLPAAVSANDIRQTQATLLEHAKLTDSASLRNVAQHLRAAVDLDHPAALARREFQQSQTRTLSITSSHDGFYLVRGQLDTEGAALLKTALAPLSSPRAATATGRDKRSAAQRCADALVDLAGRALAGGTLPTHGGVRPSLVVTMEIDNLICQIGTATLEDGTPLSPGAARRIACDAQIIPVVLGGTSQPIDVGRTRYTAPPALRRALAVRDGGCANPGCNAPPIECDVHHVPSWLDGGQTNLDTTALFCGYDHKLIHNDVLQVSMDADRRPRVVLAGQPPPESG